MLADEISDRREMLTSRCYSGHSTRGSNRTLHCEPEAFERWTSDDFIHSLIHRSTKIFWCPTMPDIKAKAKDKQIRTRHITVNSKRLYTPIETASLWHGRNSIKFISQQTLACYELCISGQFIGSS
jgi:hypothetical protein